MIFFYIINGHGSKKSFGVKVELCNLDVWVEIVDRKLEFRF